MPKKFIYLLYSKKPYTVTPDEALFMWEREYAEQRLERLMEDPEFFQDLVTAPEVMRLGISAIPLQLFDKKSLCELYKAGSLEPKDMRLRPYERKIDYIYVLRYRSRNLRGVFGNLIHRVFLTEAEAQGQIKLLQSTYSYDPDHNFEFKLTKHAPGDFKYRFIRLLKKEAETNKPVYGDLIQDFLNGMYTDGYKYDAITSEEMNKNVKIPISRDKDTTEVRQ